MNAYTIPKGLICHYCDCCPTTIQANYAYSIPDWKRHPKDTCFQCGEKLKSETFEEYWERVYAKNKN